MKTWKITLVLGLLIAFTATPTLAADNGMSFIRFGAQYVIPTGDYTDPGTGITVSAKDAAGLAFQYERKFNGLFGLEFGLAYSEHDLESKAGGISITFAEATMMPFSIAGNFHVLKEKKVDLYLGPQIAYVTYGDFAFKGPAAGFPNEAVKADFGYGALIGLDIPFGSGTWALSTQLRYLQTKAEEDVPGGIAIDINPLAIQVAAAVKF